mmetsp:Transcript_37455/g.52814  ORF Transcript_37455/g.52814 Transcript_37455/m.52814 type:complete len:174 (+) Transcript_37455:279-800(+)
MMIAINLIPKEIMNEYNLHEYVHNSYVYFEINKGTYGLPQTGKIAKDQLIELLKPHSYVECPITPGLWKHKTRDIKFFFVIDDFGFQYANVADAKHLLNILRYINAGIHQTSFNPFPTSNANSKIIFPHKHNIPNTAPRRNTLTIQTTLPHSMQPIKNVYRNTRNPPILCLCN